MNTIAKKLTGRLMGTLFLCGLLLLAACGGDAAEEADVADPADTSAAVDAEGPAEIPAEAPTEPADTTEVVADTAEVQGGGKVRLEEFQYSLLPGGARVLTGKLYNTTTEPIRNAQIQVSLFDEGNRRVASMSILVHDIPPGEFKTFREPVDTDDDEAVTGARVRGVLVL